MRSFLSRRPLAVIATLSVLSLGACVRAARAPASLSEDALQVAQQRFPEATSASLEDGRQAFVSSCNKCHGYPDLAHYADEKWPQIVERMGKKAKLSPESSDRLLQFVLASRSGPATPSATADAQP